MDPVLHIISTCISMHLLHSQPIAEILCKPLCTLLQPRPTTHAKVHKLHMIDCSYWHSSFTTASITKCPCSCSPLRLSSANHKALNRSSLGRITCQVSGSYWWHQTVNLGVHETYNITLTKLSESPPNTEVANLNSQDHKEGHLALF